MDVDKEFDSLGLTKAQKSLAWEARAKIIWGDRRDDVATWLVTKGINHATADQVVALALGERGRAIRQQGVWDLVLGIPAGLAGAGLGISAVTIDKLGVIDVPVKALAAIAAASCVAFAYGVHLTWRGLERLIGGSRVQCAVSGFGD